MDDSYGVIQQRERRGRIFLLVIALHAALLYGLSLHNFKRARLIDNETRISVIWEKPDTNKPLVSAPLPITSAPKITIPAFVGVVPPAVKADAAPEVKPSPNPAMPSQSEAANSKPLDMAQIMKDADGEAKRIEREEGSLRKQGKSGDVAPSSFEARLDRVLAHAKNPPKFFEAARVEELSTGDQIDADVHIYKITTALGSYCVTYLPGQPYVVANCPIKF